jgi:hypothetical protein
MLHILSANSTETFHINLLLHYFVHLLPSNTSIMKLYLANYVVRYYSLHDKKLKMILLIRSNLKLNDSLRLITIALYRNVSMLHPDYLK